MLNIFEISQQECFLITNLTFPYCFILRVLCLHYYHIYGKNENQTKEKTKDKEKIGIGLIEPELFCISVKDQQAYFWL